MFGHCVASYGSGRLNGQLAYRPLLCLSVLEARESMRANRSGSRSQSVPAARTSWRAGSVIIKASFQANARRYRLDRLCCCVPITRCKASKSWDTAEGAPTVSKEWRRLDECRILVSESAFSAAWAQFLASAQLPKAIQRQKSRSRGLSFPQDTLFVFAFDLVLLLWRARTARTLSLPGLRRHRGRGSICGQPGHNLGFEIWQRHAWMQ